MVAVKMMLRDQEQAAGLEVIGEDSETRDAYVVLHVITCGELNRLARQTGM